MKIWWILVPSGFKGYLKVHIVNKLRIRANWNNKRHRLTACCSLAFQRAHCLSFWFYGQWAPDSRLYFFHTLFRPRVAQSFAWWLKKTVFLIIIFVCFPSKSRELIWIFIYSMLTVEPLVEFKESRKNFSSTITLLLWVCMWRDS